MRHLAANFISDIEGFFSHHIAGKSHTSFGGYDLAVAEFDREEKLVRQRLLLVADRWHNLPHLHGVAGRNFLEGYR